jgi:hypothetical protein
VELVADSPPQAVAPAVSTAAVSTAVSVRRRSVLMFEMIVILETVPILTSILIGSQSPLGSKA